MTPIVFYPHALRAVLYGTSDELFTLSVLDDVQPSHNFRDLVQFAAAQVGPYFSGTHMASPDNRITTPQLGTLLSVTIPGDYYIVRNLGNYVTDLHYKAGQNLGLRYADASTNHFRMRADRNTVLVLESISCEDGQQATARFRLCHVYNATVGTDPLVPTAGVALTANSTGGDLATLGPIKLNGSWLKGVVGWNLENNIEYDEVSDSGEGFLSYCGIKNYRPVLSIRSRQTDYMATFGSRGTPLTSLYCYLREKLQSGINEADAAPAHTLIQNAGYGTIKARGVTGNSALCEVSVDLLQPSQNTAAYSIAVNQAIT